MSVKKLIAASLWTACLVCGLPACTSQEETPAPAELDSVDLDAVDLDSAEYVATSRKAMTKLGTALKTRLQSAMADGGLVAALEVCNVEAVPIAETISIEEGVLVGRTSLRTRSQRNTPDAWEREILDQFSDRLRKGEDIGSLDAWTVTTNAQDQRTFRYMKAIPTAPLCLSCHGSELDAQVAAKIAELYPDDAATGFAAGDIRGAFTVVKPID